MSTRYPLMSACLLFAGSLFTAQALSQEAAEPAATPAAPAAPSAPAEPAQPGPGPMAGYPYGQMPMMPPHYRGGMPMHGCKQRGMKGPMAGQRHQMMQAHRQQMEERLARIEELLQQLVDKQQ